jgi:hypothetical protein
MRKMNKKTLRVILILTSLLSVIYFAKPQIAQVSASGDELFVFNRVAPQGTIYRGDTVLFGGTIYNNHSEDTFVLVELIVELLDIFNTSISQWLNQSASNIGPFSFQSLVSRNTVEPYESRTFAFEQEIDDRVPLGENYTMRMKLVYINTIFEDDRFINQTIVGANITNLNIELPERESPNYIYVVFVVLLLGIVAFIIIGIVGWVRERRSKQ